VSSVSAACAHTPVAAKLLIANAIKRGSQNWNEEEGKSNPNKAPPQCGAIIVGRLYFISVKDASAPA
jgi:hypothetical protein